MSKQDDMVVSAVAPVTPSVGNCFVAASSAVAAEMDLTTHEGKFVTVQAQGADLFVLFGETGVDGTIDDTATSGDGQCMMIPQGQERSFFLQPSDPNSFMGYKNAAGNSGNVRVYVSSLRSAEL